MILRTILILASLAAFALGVIKLREAERESCAPMATGYGMDCSAHLGTMG